MRYLECLHKVGFLNFFSFYYVYVCVWGGKALMIQICGSRICTLSLQLCHWYIQYPETSKEEKLIDWATVSEGKINKRK